MSHKPATSPTNKANCKALRVCLLMSESFTSGCAFTTAAAGITIARAAGNAASALWGVPDIDNFLNNPDVPLTNYIGHDTSRDSLYEMSVPLSALGLTRATLEANGIGIFIYVGSTSSIDSIPNDHATMNSPGTTDSNSSIEWEDTDVFTSPFARIVK